MKAILKNNMVDFVKYNGSNIDEIKAFVHSDDLNHRIYRSITDETELYISGIGVLQKGNYIYITDFYTGYNIVSHKVFSRMVEENINSLSDDNSLHYMWPEEYTETINNYLDAISNIGGDISKHIIARVYIGDICFKLVNMDYKLDIRVYVKNINKHSSYLYFSKIDTSFNINTFKGMDIHDFKRFMNVEFTFLIEGSRNEYLDTCDLRQKAHNGGV